MGDKSKIEWTEATWNPTVGCSVISPGCTNCYAMKMAARIEAMAIGQTTKNGSPGLAPTYYAGTTQPSKAGPVWTGKLALAPEDVLFKPLRWKRPRMIFVNSMSDLFHESVPDEWIDRVFAVMALCPQHTFQVLTKRAGRMCVYLSENDMAARVAPIGAAMMEDSDRNYSALRWQQWPLPNVWLGVSTEDQKRADERIPHLLETPAAIRFVSAEPLLGPIDLTHIDLPGGDEEIFPLGWPAGRDDQPCHPFLDWVIVGGESGPNARPMHPDWARSIRDQCQAAGVPFFFKQWGEWVSVSEVEGPGEHFRFPDGATVRRTGRKIAGRTLDGCEYSRMPERANG